MATTYDAIYERAIFRFMDYDFLKLSNDQRASMLERHLRSAIVDFQSSCQTDLTQRDETLKTFKEVLTDEEQEILSLGVAYYWVSFKALNSDLLRNNMSTRDYSYFSPANLLGEVRALRDTLKKEYDDRIIAYSYLHGGIEKWKV